MTMKEHRRVFIQLLVAFFAQQQQLLTTTTTTTGGVVHAFAGMPSSRFFVKKQDPQTEAAKQPKLILIGGPPGTGKSTFGMSVALDQGILKCISTDTVRAVMRSFVSEEISPALHRSSYAPAFVDDDDPVRSWRETCQVLQTSVEGLIEDSLNRGTSIVVEGVHVIPDNRLIKKWCDAGGTAIGCILQISKEDKHKKQLLRRGVMTGVLEAEERKIADFDRIRKIQDELIRLAKENNWLQIEQRTAPDPLDLVGSALYGASDDSLLDDLIANCKIEEEEEEEIEEMYDHLVQNNNEQPIDGEGEAAAASTTSVSIIKFAGNNNDNSSDDGASSKVSDSNAVNTKTTNADILS